MISGVYKITNTITNKCYIGSSVDIIGRWYQHKTALKFNKHHSVRLQRSYNIHGKDNFKYEIVEECPTEELIIKEQYYIDLFECYKNGYNSTMMAGSVMYGRKHTDETKEKLKNASKGNKNRLGMTFTEESKKKISDKLKGKPLSEETKQKMSKSRKGRIISEETRVKLHNANIGRKLSEEHKIKLSLSKIGKKQSAETIAHRVELNTGKKRSEEVKKKMSESMTGVKKGPMSEENKLKRSKRISVILSDGEIKEYNSIKQCAIELNIHQQRINEFFSGKRKSYKNLKFKLL